MTDDLNRRLRSLYSRGVVRQADMQAGLASLQAEYLKDEVRRTEVPQLYGFASMPLAGAEIHSIFFNGQRDMPVAFAVDDRRYRGKLQLQAGETALYGKNVGDTLGHHIISTASPKAGTFLAFCSRFEFQLGDTKVVLDKDDGVTVTAAHEIKLVAGGHTLEINDSGVHVDGHLV
jgi:phage gp45-like